MEFSSNNPPEIEVFRSGGVVSGGQMLGQLFAQRGG